MAKKSLYRARARRALIRAPDRIVALFEHATPLERLEGQRWYPEAHRLAQSLALQAGLSVRAVAAIMAALSPSCTWETCVRDTKAMIETNGAHTPSSYGTNARKARSILAGAKPEAVIGGPKVTAFYALIADPSDASTVVIDRHAARVAVGGAVGNIAVLSEWIDAAYDDFADAFRAAAERLNESPSVAQATTWITFRNLLQG